MIQHLIPSGSKAWHKAALGVAAGCALLAAPADGGAAETFPARPVTLVVPYPPGGGADILARTVARYLSREWNHPVIVESRAGGGTTIGAGYVARAKPDGYTLLVSVTQHAIAPSLFKQLPYDYLTDLAPVALLSDSPFILTVPERSPLDSLPKLLDALKQKGASMNFGSSGPASVPHLAGELLNQAANAKASHIPFPGTAPAFTALLGEQIDYLFGDTSVLPSVQAGKVRALAVTTRERSPSLPKVPAVSEFIPGFALSSWVGLEAPASTPQPVIASINATVQKILKDPELAKAFAETAKEPLFSTPAQYAEFRKSEVEKFRKLTRDIGVKLE
ncbi:MAG: tripartite tricarboxylate transporter substrate-binding protein [Pigmentiphaga sp.]|uniref:Bug family tripartite tricarboxylate transporter substrate binding protein n=1 Tax=Pigmentiphaga sp. TaxID=1977564 RepID=UPI0029A616A0|nr:tripartite tricarboxylate transporter substrate-binding protein [Pigmentiphaga sp.]MDX3905178.1 tripartite tricarboxylate transporter substrate-binding protein [Pigmentiphaga sp.]